jgi:hypothetical protein
MLPRPPDTDKHAVRLLQGYTGVLQTDGYAAYRSLADPKRAGGPATLAFCWAHWRRQWFDIAKSPPAPTATEALKRIAELYEIVRAHTQSLPCAFSVGWPQEIVSSTPGKPRLNAIVLRRSQSICLSGRVTLYQGSAGEPGRRRTADASPTSSRMPAHGLGPMRVATPSSQWTCTTYSLPVSRRTRVKTHHPYENKQSCCS